MCRKRGRCGSCSSSKGLSLSIYDRSKGKGYTDLELDEWLQRLNSLIDGGVVAPSDSFSINGIGITTIDGQSIDDILSGATSDIQSDVEGSTFISDNLITDVGNTTHQIDGLITEVNS